MTAGLTYALTLLYIGVGQVLRSRKINLAIQITGDLLVETVLVYFTGGLDSPFSFLYLVSIITASMLLYRRGGLFSRRGAPILFRAPPGLFYYSGLPTPPPTQVVSAPPGAPRPSLSTCTHLSQV